MRQRLCAGFGAGATVYACSARGGATVYVWKEELLRQTNDEEQSLARNGR